jgi:hypothetical protein
MKIYILEVLNTNLKDAKWEPDISTASFDYQTVEPFLLFEGHQYRVAEFESTGETKPCKFQGRTKS